jgi:hypothetical protein
LKRLADGKYQAKFLHTVEVGQIYMLIEGLNKNKKEKIGNKTDLSPLVTRPGFEPGQAESESAILPLYYRAFYTM